MRIAVSVFVVMVSGCFAEPQYYVDGITVYPVPETGEPTAQCMSRVVRWARGSYDCAGGPRPLSTVHTLHWESEPWVAEYHDGTGKVRGWVAGTGSDYGPLGWVLRILWSPGVVSSSLIQDRVERRVQQFVDQTRRRVVAARRLALMTRCGAEAEPATGDVDLGVQLEQ